MKPEGRNSTVAFLISLTSLCTFTYQARAWECSPPCSTSACEECEGGVCVYQCDEDNCEECFEGSCIECFGGACETCASGTCVSDCGPCYGCVAGSCIYMCTPGQTCCDNGCCDSACCGTEGCCPSTQYCCGSTECCNEDEVCCYAIGSGEYYCNPPCSDEVTDTTSCSEENEDAYKCTGCHQLTAPICGTYRNYSGLLIETCHDGCPATDWNTSNEICYQEKDCFPMFHADSWCTECEGEEFCAPVFPIMPGGVQCQSIGECAVEIACTLAGSCYQCEELGTVLYTSYEETCSCQ